MSKKLSFSIAVNLLTENFKKGTNAVKNSLHSMQMQVLTFAAALGAGGLGLAGLVTRFKDVARETNKVLTALKNVSVSTKGFADNLSFLNNMANKYGLEVNALTGNFAKFTASSTQANMPMDQQRKVFESLSRASAAFGLSAQDTNGVFLALSQMMGKGKISSEELRKQMGERIPIAMQAMAKAAGVSMSGLEKLLKQGKLLSSDIIPKFADALNEMLPAMDTDNLETSLNRLSNTFRNIVDSSGFQNKYKALIDGLNSLLQTASKNIQNIAVGIMAAIAFVVTNASSKILKGWWSMASEMTTGQQKLNADLTKATASRVAAQNAMETARLKHSVAIGNSKVKLAQDVALKEKMFSRAVMTEEFARMALETSNTGKRVNLITRVFNTIKIGAAKLIVSLKSLWNSFAPAIIVSGLMAIAGYFRNIYKESRQIKKSFSEYRKEVERVGNTQEVKTLQAQLSIMNDKTKSQKEVNAAQESLQKMLGNEKLRQEEINKAVENRIELLKTAARADYFAQKAVTTEDKIKELAQSIGLSYEDAVSLVGQLPAQLPDRTDHAGNAQYAKMVEEAFKGKKKEGLWSRFWNHKKIYDVIPELQSELSILKDAEEELKKAENSSNALKITDGSVDDDLDQKTLRAAEKRLEALRKIDEADRKRQIEKRKFDLDMQQKELDLLDDSFEKRTKQILLNLEKENIEIEELQSEQLKKQYDFLKDKFISLSPEGSELGFEAYFESLQKKNFKEKDGTDILPEGLRTEDIAKEIEQRLKAAQEAYYKANNNILKDATKILENERLIFENELNQTIANIKKHYEELKKQWNENSEEYKELQSFEDKEIELAKLAHNRKVLNSIQDLHGKQIELTTKFYLLQSKKELALLKQRQKNNGELIKNLQREFNIVAGKKFESLSDEELQNLINEYPELITLIQTAILEQAKLNQELKNIPVRTFTEISGIVSGVVSELSNLEGEIGSLFSDIGKQLNNIQTAFDEEASSSDKISGAFSGIVSVINMISSASKQRKQAEREYYKNAIAFAHEYVLALNEQLRLNSQMSGSGFIRNFAGQINDGYKALSNAVNNYQESLDKLSEGKVKKDLVSSVDWGNVGKGTLSGLAAGASIGSFAGPVGTAVGAVVGAAVGFFAGLFGGKKKENKYTEMMDVFPGLVDEAGNLDRVLAEVLVNTEQVDDKTKQLLQNALDWADAVEVANEQIKNTVLELAGDLGDNLKTAIVDAWKAGEDASKKMFEVAGRSLENFIENMIFSATFSDTFDRFAEELSNSLNPATGDGDIVDDYLRLINDLNELDDIYIALLESIKERPETTGFGLWSNADSTNQTASSKGFQSMDQDTGNRLDGRFTALQMSGIKIEGLLSSITVSGNNTLNMISSINGELQKHTNLFNEMREIQKNSYYRIEDIMSYLKGIPEALDRIRENTSRL